MKEPEERALGREDRMQREDGWVSFWDNSGRLVARVPDDPDPRATVSYGTLPPRKPLIVPPDPVREPGGPDDQNEPAP